VDWAKCFGGSCPETSTGGGSDRTPEKKVNEVTFDLEGFSKEGRLDPAVRSRGAGQCHSGVGEGSESEQVETVANVSGPRWGGEGNVGGGRAAKNFAGNRKRGSNY